MANGKGMDAKAFVKKYGLNVEGYLDLEGTQITSLPDNLTVGGYLDLRGTQITSLPDNLTVGGSLYLEGTQITSLPDNLTVGGYLDLEGTQITSLPDNLTVGGYLDLRGTQITSLPDNLTVGGSLYLEGTQITSLPDNLTVGGYLDLEGTQISDSDAEKTRSKSLPEGFLLSWQGGKYVSADGVFSEVVSHKGDIYRTRQIGKERVEYLVTDRKGKWAHGATLEAARADLIYKIGRRDKSVYADLTLDSVISFEKGIEAYRVITGACSAGTRGFVERLESIKEQYSIREICELTKGQYGNSDFVQFFSK